MFTETIFALSSGALPAGIAVIRLSGPHVRHILETIVGGVPTARHAGLVDIRDRKRSLLDRGLVLFFEAPASVTGEDCAELHVHGGRAVVAALLRTLGEFDGVRQADAGEFTRRAFLNGKMDLTGAEALADLLAADTEMQRRLALENAGGSQRELYDGWRASMVRSRAMIEAALDFTDEDDVSEYAWESERQHLGALASEIEKHRGGYAAAEMIRDGFRIVILGSPNAGKSSLLNAIARRDVAIVTDEPGTTRDLIEVPVDLGGYKVVFTDTAGIRDGAGRVESIGIERALGYARSAHLLLLLEDAADRRPMDLGSDRPTWRVGSKTDLLPPDDWDEAVNRYDHLVSAHTGVGIQPLLDAIRDRLDAMIPADHGVLPSRVRHDQLLGTAAGHLRQAAAMSEADVVAEELRLAAEALGRVTGTIDTEEVLGAIFSEFCIGK
ncbi:MAG: tRNA uridine-5-carboxymethylaminomethyl(34) synthesis GTPase MnmE [Rhizobiaceae bacterium]|nr:tRNA uridine-5-carboxymethylaminomethyl(34) synthesis GTPase MnmE [Rhizobiaceae bacterium]